MKDDRRCPSQAVLLTAEHTAAAAVLTRFFPSSSSVGRSLKEQHTDNIFRIVAAEELVVCNNAMYEMYACMV
jgi:hypothetical protein